MKALILFFGLLLSAAQALANPALHGTWSAVVDGQPMVVKFAEGGRGLVDGNPMRWQTMGNILLIEQDGDVGSYSYRLQGKQLTVSGGELGGTVVFSAGQAAAAKSKPVPANGSSSSGRELVGKWCKGGAFSANAGGGSSSMTCFELRANGTYTYEHEGSMSAYSPGMWGGTTSQSSDAGRWQVSGNRLTAHSQSGSVNTYTIEKRNNPKNRRDPMICLDGDCYTSYWQKQPW